MNSPLFSSAKLARALLVGSLLGATGCSTFWPRRPAAPPVPAAPAEPAAPPVAEGAFDDDPREPTAHEAAVIAAGLDPAKLAEVEAQMLAAVQNPAASPAELQDAAQSLGLALLAGSPGSQSATLAALAPLLADPARVDYARLALDRVPGPEVDALYVNALATTSGRTALGLMDSTGSRRIASAVPALAALLNDTDQPTATAAARALGQIGGNAAMAALEKSANPLAPAVLNARLAAAGRSDPATAAFVAQEIYRNPAAPLAQRSAALRGLIAAQPSNVIDEIHRALAGTEPAFQAVAIESVSTLPAAASLSLRLASYVPAVQVPLIAALGSRGDAGSVPALLEALEAKDPATRLAAIESLGRLRGNPEVATRLATLASGKGDEAKAAFASLSRLHGPGMDDFVRTSAASDELQNSIRVVYIQQLAARNQTEAIPFLLGLRQSPEETLRLEALDALRAIAASKDEPAIIAWALAAPKAEQGRAVRALITILLREGNVATRANTVIAALNAGDSDARIALLPILSRVAGPAALAAAGALAQDANETVATTATAELARWPDVSALPVLTDLAVRSKTENIRNSAVQAATRILTQGAGVSATDRSIHTRAFLALPLPVPAQLGLIHALSLCADEPALATAKNFLADPATSAAAQDAVDAIISNLAGAYIFTASNAQQLAARAGDGRLRTYWMVPIIPGEWLRADLHHSRPVRKITLEQGGREWDFPAAVDIQVSDDPEQPGEVRVQAEGERYRTVITLPAGTRGRYLWIRQTGTRSGPWAVAELLVE